MTQPHISDEPSAPQQGNENGNGQRAGSLFTPEDSARFRSRWDSLQASFVEDPKDTLQEADYLIGNIVDAIAEALRIERAALESRWHADEPVSTETLRTTMQHYRAQVERLLTLGE